MLEQAPEGLVEISRQAKAEYETSNNRMELTAVIEALKAHPVGSRLRIFSDSGYVVTGYTDPSYLKKWIHNGWKNSKREPIANADLWVIMNEIARQYDLQLVLIRGHGKNNHDEHNQWNNAVDKMCTATMKDMMAAQHRLNDLLGGV